MIKLNKDTGVLTWDKYEITPRETWDAFAEKYPDFKLTFEKMSPNNALVERIFTAPILDFQSHRIQLEVVFYSHYLSILNIRRVAENLGDDPEFWKSELLHWVTKTHEWLVSQLGKPHTVKAGVLFDEHERMTIDEINQLKSWEYILDWGHAGFYYDGLQEPGDIFIHPSYHYQIRNWDELLAEYDYLAQNATDDNEDSKHIPAMRRVIEGIRDHFDYQEVYPRLNLDKFNSSLMFHLKQWSYWEQPKWVSLDISISHSRGIYCVTRPDTTRKLYTSDMDTLIDGLKEFIAGTNL